MEPVRGSKHYYPVSQQYKDFFCKCNSITPLKVYQDNEKYVQRFNEFEAISESTSKSLRNFVLVASLRKHSESFQNRMLA